MDLSYCGPDYHKRVAALMIQNTPRGTALRFALAAALLVPVLFLSACNSAPAKPKTPLVGWRHITDFSGRGSTQTESFNIEATQWRIKWETKGDTTPSTGTLLLMVNSAVSGRPIALGVEHNGNGKGIAYVTEDPRYYYLVITSENLDWSLSIDEEVLGQPKGS
jgi:hypothetical protein